MKSIFRVAFFIAVFVGSDCKAQTTKSMQAKGNEPSREVTSRFILEKLNSGENVTFSPNSYILDEVPDGEPAPYYDYPHQINYEAKGSLCAIVETSTFEGREIFNKREEFNFGDVKNVKLMSMSQAHDEAVVGQSAYRHHHFKFDYPTLLIGLDKPFLVDPDLVLSNDGHGVTGRPKTEAEKQESAKYRTVRLLSFLHEDTAQRVAKAITHAAELCGVAP